MLCNHGYWIHGEAYCTPTSRTQSITSAGFSNYFKQWHITNHDVYGNDFIQAWESSGHVEICPEDMEAIPQEDEHKKIY